MKILGLLNRKAILVAIFGINLFGVLTFIYIEDQNRAAVKINPESLVNCKDVHNKDVDAQKRGPHLSLEEMEMLLHDLKEQLSREQRRDDQTDAVVAVPEHKKAAIRYDRRDASVAGHKKPVIFSARKVPYVSIGKLHQDRMSDNYNYCNETAMFYTPKRYIKESKNPCWYSNNGQLLCIPYFYIAGFSKGGTSDVFSRMRHHPQVVTGAKEKHYFDYKRYYHKQGTLEYFASLFGKTSTTIQDTIRKTGHSNKITGDGTPCTAWYSLYWPCYEGNAGLEEPRYTNADVIYRLNPSTKVIFMVREPATRLYSRFLAMLGFNLQDAYARPSPETFHNLTVAAINKYKKCFKEWTPRHCAYNGTLYTQAYSRLQEGMYSTYLKDWFKVFPRKQLLIIKFEDYVEDTPRHLKEIFKFLELDPIDEKALQKISRMDPVNKGRKYKLGSMLNETRELLEEFYAPFVQELSHMLNDNRFLWHYFPEKTRTQEH